MHKIEIQGKEYDAQLTIDEWSYGISVLVTILDEEKIFLTSKIMCSESASVNYEEISKLSEETLLEEAWLQFKNHYPFEKLKETLQSGVEVLLPWR